MPTVAAVQGHAFAAAAMLLPSMPDYLAIAPVWAPGMMGVMQLAILDQLSQRLSSRKSA